MKTRLPLLVLLAGIILTGVTLVPPRNSGAIDIVGFGRLPTLVNGRLKPLDTVARTSLLVLQGRQRVSDPAISEPFVNSPAEWLLDMLFAPAKADTYPVFRIDSPDLLTLMGLTEDDTKIGYDSTAKRLMAAVGFLPSHRARFSIQQIGKNFAELDRQAKLADAVETPLRTSFQRAVVQLRDNVILYQRLQDSLVARGTDNYLEQILALPKTLPDGLAAVNAQRAGQPHDTAAAKALLDLSRSFATIEAVSYLLPIPPESGMDRTADWRSAGASLTASLSGGRVNPAVMAYTGLGLSWRGQQPEAFNSIVKVYREQLEKQIPARLLKCDVEARFNSAQPFYTSMMIYVLAFLLGVFSWLKWPDTLGRSAFWLVLLAWVLATVGIGIRMWLESRPPVTNLYSSALFVGWGAVALCLVLETVYKNAIGSVAAGLVGFATLLIAHHLSLTGDTLEMMRAVLDSNFWLATHVVTVTIGYAATFLAGFLALIYIVRGVFTRSLDKATADALARMVYGIVCFATLFSFVGTVLGGIWADQSWGRFWGWDPKENGALIIVVWNAIILHARWGGLVKQRGLMSLAVFGNIVTSWSWFGTNMLGVGLHSYGFTDAAFMGLIGFVASQLAFIALASLPLEKWRSFRAIA
jgi:ABC-type transport system involved in cytochrome c biogenesis permease subunit